MNWIDWFHRASSPLTKADDVVWRTESESLIGLREAIAHRLQRGDSVVLVAHFPSEFVDLMEHIEGVYEYELIKRPILGEEMISEDGDTKIWLAPAKALAPGSPPASYNAQQTLSFLVIGRHFLRSADQALCDFALSIPCRTYLRHFLSFEHQIWKRANDSELAFLQGITLSANEAISSRIITNRLDQLQKSIEVDLDRPPIDTECPDQWLKTNKTRK